METETKKAETTSTASASASKPENKGVAKNLSDDSKVMALLSYISILSIVMYVIKKDDEYVVFHAKQGMVLLGISVVLMFVGIIPIIGWAIGILGWLFVIVMAIIGMIKAYQGEKYEMPVIIEIAKKINF